MAGDGDNVIELFPRDDRLESRNERRVGRRLEPLAVSVLEAGEMIGQGRTRVFELLKTNQLEAVRFGRSTRVTVRSLEALIERNSSWRKPE